LVYYKAPPYIIASSRRCINPIYIGVQKPGPQYSPAIYTMDIASNIDIRL